jgi:hypothetical protein
MSYRLFFSLGRGLCFLSLTLPSACAVGCNLALLRNWVHRLGGLRGDRVCWGVGCQWEAWLRCGLSGFEIVGGLGRGLGRLRWWQLRARAWSLRDRDGRGRPSRHLRLALPALDGRKRPSPHGPCCRRLCELGGRGRRQNPHFPQRQGEGRGGRRWRGWECDGALDDECGATRWQKFDDSVTFSGRCVLTIRSGKK